MHVRSERWKFKDKKYIFEAKNGLASVLPEECADLAGRSPVPPAIRQRGRARPEASVCSYYSSSSFYGGVSEESETRRTEIPTFMVGENQ